MTNHPPALRLRSLGFLSLLWIVSVALLILAKRQSLDEAYYWDAVGCYIPQARELARHGFHLSGYHGLPFIRPPLYTGALAAVMHYLSPAREALRIATILWCALCLPAVYAICRGLGGRRGAALLAMGLCGISPIFYAQLGMLQTDLPAAALCACAWALILFRQRAGFALAASLAVLTKESTIFICLPAALLTAGRHAKLWAAPEQAGRVDTASRLGRLVRAFLYAWPTALPAVVLLSWLLLHRHLTGHLVAADHLEAMFSLPTLGNALLHSFVESGRPFLVVAAVPAVLHALRSFGTLRRKTLPTELDASADRCGEVLMTALGVLALPLIFSAGLPRYMLLSLPLLCALAALGLQRLTREQRLGATILLAAALLLSWHGDSIHENGGHHLERNQDYQALLRLHVQAAQELQAEHPRLVLCAFPMTSILTAPPSDGYLPAPVPARYVHGDAPLSELCQFDFLVEADGGSVQRNKDRLLDAGALTLWKRIGDRKNLVGARSTTPRWARADHEIRIYRVACPAQR